MSRAYREMVERFPELYGLTDDYRQRLEWEQMEAEHSAWLKDAAAQAEYNSWLNALMNQPGE